MRLKPPGSWPIPWKIGATLGLSFVLLGLALGIGYREARTLAGLGVRMAAGERSVGALYRVSARMLEAETAERGYVITGDPTYAAAFDSAALAVPRLLTELTSGFQALPSDTLTLLSRRTTQELSYLSRVIEVRRRGGFQASWRLIQSGQSVRLMTTIRRLVNALADGEAATVVRETRVQQRASGRITVALLILGVLGFTPIGIGFGILHRDGTRQRLVAETLRESEARYRLLFDGHPDPAWVYDRETLRFLAVNDAATRRYLYSRDEFMTMTIRDIRPPGELSRLDQLLTRSEPGPGAFTGIRHRRKDATVIDVEVSVDSIPFAGRSARLVVARDVTDRLRLEQQFRQSQKLEAVGRLAGGVAHDFNNILTAIGGYAAMLLEDLPAGDRRHEDVRQIIMAVDRAATLTRQLLAFSRKQVFNPQVLDLNELIANLEKLLKRVIGEDIQFVASLAPDLGSVRADPGQIEQVIMNLVVNARDAMAQGGKLTLETTNVELDQEYARLHPPMTAGPYVMLAVSDTGIGMDEATQARIFEPFFTTKPLGQGTGLGLSTVYGIVKQSVGHIWLYSEQGHGTTFKIYLPRVAEPATPLARPAAAPAAHGHETILVVEDEAAVRRTTCRALERLGYTVLEAPTAAAALALAQRQPGTIHLLLTDVVMPETGGRELARQLLAHRPGTRVLYMSGYPGDAVIRHGQLELGTAYLQKPFTPTALATKVREVLDAAT